MLARSNQEYITGLPSLALMGKLPATFAQGHQFLSVPQGVGAMPVVAVLSPAARATVQQHPKTATTTNLLNDARNMFAPNSKPFNDITEIGRICSFQLREADSGRLFDRSVGSQFTPIFEDFDGADLIRGRLTSMLQSQTAGLPDPCDPVNAALAPQEPSPGIPSRTQQAIERYGDAKERLCALHRLEEEAVKQYQELRQLEDRAAELGREEPALMRAEIDAREQSHQCDADVCEAEARHNAVLKQVNAAVADNLKPEPRLLEQREVLAKQMHDARAAAKEALDKQLAAHSKLAGVREAMRKAEADARELRQKIAAKKQNMEAELRDAEASTEEAREEIEAAKLLEGCSHPGVLPHQIMYVCPNGESMTAPMAFMVFVCSLLTVKWGYPPQAQLHDLGCIPRGQPKFPGEESLVLPDEDYEAYLARTAGYMQLCALVGRDRDISDAVLQGLGDSALDTEVRKAVQLYLMPLAARDRTPALIAQMVRKAVRSVSASLEAQRQQRLELEAAQLGLSAAAFGREEVPLQAPRIKPANVVNGLKRPEEGWTVQQWEQIDRLRGTKPDELCHLHTRLSAKTLHTNAQCTQQRQQPDAAAADVQGLVQQLAQLLTPQVLSTAHVQKAAVSTPFAGAASQVDPVCGECHRRHPVGACWGADMANAPPYIRRRGSHAATAGVSPRGYQQQQPQVPSEHQQVDAAVAGVHQLYPVEGMHPASLAYGVLSVADLLPAPRPESYAHYEGLGSYVPSGQHQAMACGLVCRLSDYVMEEVTPLAEPDVFDDAASCCSFATACSTFTLCAGCKEECVLAALTASGAVEFAEGEQLARVSDWVGEHAVLSGGDQAEVVIAPAPSYPLMSVVAGSSSAIEYEVASKLPVALPGWFMGGKLLTMWSSSWLGMGSVAALGPFHLEMGGACHGACSGELLCGVHVPGACAAHAMGCGCGGHLACVSQGR